MVVQNTVLLAHSKAELINERLKQQEKQRRTRALPTTMSKGAARRSVYNAGASDCSYKALSTSPESSASTSRRVTETIPRASTVGAANLLSPNTGASPSDDATPGTLSASMSSF